MLFSSAVPCQAFFGCGFGSSTFFSRGTQGVTYHILKQLNPCHLTAGCFAKPTTSICCCLLRSFIGACKGFGYASIHIKLQATVVNRAFNSFPLHPQMDIEIRHSLLPHSRSWNQRFHVYSMPQAVCEQRNAVVDQRSWLDVTVTVPWSRTTLRLYHWSGVILYWQQRHAFC